MKVLYLISSILLTVFIVSCGKNVSTQPLNAEGFGIIEETIKSEFGEDAYYTDLQIIYDSSMGNSLSMTVTKIPESLEMEEWIFSKGAWKQTADISLEVPKGSKASDFMFQLDNRINLRQLGELVETSVKNLKEEKNIDDPRLKIAFIKYPKNGDISEAEYVVNLEPKNGGTSFSYSYTLNGELIDMNY